MSANYDLERRIADHYSAEAPLRAPDWVLDRVLASVDTTPQRRTVLGWPWRFLNMPFSAKLALTAVAIVAVGLVGFTLVKLPAVGPAGSPSPTASPSPLTQPPPLTERFDSPLHGLSISYPSGWQVRAATQVWTNRFVPNFNSPTGDVIFDPALRDGLYLVLTSFGPDGPIEEWHGLKAWPDPCSETDGGDIGPHVSYTLDGAQGYVLSWVCDSGDASRHATEVATASRGYIIYLYVGSESQLSTYDQAWFQAALETVDLRPEDAVDAP